MAKGSIAIFHSNAEMYRSADQTFPFRQDSALFSMTGIDQPGTTLVLYPDAAKKSLREILFILPSDPFHLLWNGPRLSPKKASTISGISTVYLSERWDNIMTPLLHQVSRVYTHASEDHEDHPSRHQDRMTARLKSLFPFHQFIPASHLLQDLLMKKHPVELDLMRKAIDITAQAFDRVLQSMRPGIKEFEIEAELSYVFQKNGCTHAFEPIVASGANACILHYITNDHTIRKGDLVLLDFGAAYANMNADVSRTLPANGKFSKEQIRFYKAVLYVLEVTTQMMVSGTTIKDLNKEAGHLIEAKLTELKVIRRHEIKKQDRNRPLWKKYFMHGIGHHLGWDVHDTSSRDAIFRPGMVLTCEPGIYIPEMKLGIRLENDILITRKGNVNLTRQIPIQPEDIESRMQS